MNKFFVTTVTLVFVAFSSICQAMPVTNEFNDLGGSGWSSWGCSIQNNSTSPNAPNSVEVIFPAGWKDGHNPGQVCYTNLSVSEVYAGFWLKIQEGYYQHPVIQKIAYLKTNYESSGGVSNIFMGIDAGRTFCLEEQPGWTRSRRNVGKARYTPGSWVWVEMYFKMNTPGQHNGIARLWVTPQGGSTTLAVDLNDVPFVPSGYSNGKFVEFQLCPIFGGYIGESNPYTWKLWYDLFKLDTKQIGYPGAGPVPTDTIPPSPPQGLKVVD